MRISGPSWNFRLGYVQTSQAPLLWTDACGRDSPPAVRKGCGWHVPPHMIAPGHLQLQRCKLSLVRRSDLQNCMSYSNVSNCNYILVKIWRRRQRLARWYRTRKKTLYNPYFSSLVCFLVVFLPFLHPEGSLSATTVVLILVFVLLTGVLFSKNA